eukprot:8937494-Alexandrium_andersonii.AAC.1
MEALRRACRDLGGPPSGDGVATARGGGTVRLSQEKAPLSSLVWRAQAAKRARRVAARWEASSSW